MFTGGATEMAVQPWEDHLRTILQALSVLGTVVTIVLALFLQWILANVRRPRLGLSMSQDADDEDWVCLDFEDRIELYVRIRVCSQAGKVTAHNSEILLLKVTRPATGSNAPVVPTRQLAWADTPEERLAIPSGTWRRVDVLKLSLGLNGTQEPILVPALKRYEEEAARTVGSHRQLATERELLREGGSYAFDLAVTADEIEASRWRLSFMYTPAKAFAARDFLTQITQVDLRPLA